MVPPMKSPKQRRRLRQRVLTKLLSPRKLATGISSRECLALAVKKRLSKPVYLLMRRRLNQLLLRARRLNQILSQHQVPRRPSQSPKLKQKRLKQKSLVSLSRFFRRPIRAKKRRPNLLPSQRLLRRRPNPQTNLSQHQQTQQLLEDATTDALTKLSNRRAFDKSLNERFELARTGAPLSVIFTDVDHFKSFNDNHGHAVGDAVLVAFAQTLKDAVGVGGTVYRYGGEEFAVLCPGLPRHVAAELAERMRGAVETSCTVPSDTGAKLGVTCSLGVATHDGATFSRAEVLLKASDRAVYAAKEAGRNRVRVFTPHHESAAAAADKAA